MRFYVVALGLFAGLGECFLVLYRVNSELDADATEPQGLSCSGMCIFLSTQKSSLLTWVYPSYDTGIITTSIAHQSFKDCTFSHTILESNLHCLSQIWAIPVLLRRELSYLPTSLERPSVPSYNQFWEIDWEGNVSWECCVLSYVSYLETLAVGLSMLIALGALFTGHRWHRHPDCSAELPHVLGWTYLDGCRCVCSPVPS